MVFGVEKVRASRKIKVYFYPKKPMVGIHGIAISEFNATELLATTSTVPKLCI